MIANIFKILLGLLLIPVYVKYVTPEELGMFDLLLSISPLIVQTISLGLMNSLSKFYLENNNTAYLFYIKDKLLKNTFIVLAILLISYILFGSDNIIDINYFLIFIVMIFLEVLSFVYYRIYYLNETYKKASQITVLADLFRYVFLITLVILMDDKLLALLIGSTMYWVYLLIQSYYDNRSLLEDKKELSKAEIITLRKYSYPLILLGFSGFLYLSLDRIMVNFLTDSLTEVAYLGMAQRLVTIASVVITSVITVVGITMFKTNDLTKLREIQNKYLYFLLLLISIILFFYLAFEDIIINLLLTDIYKNSFIIGVLLLTSLYWNKSRENLEYYYLVNNNTKLITSYFVVFTILNITLNFYFINLYGALGAVISTNISFFFHAITLLILLRIKKHKISTIPFIIGIVLNIFVIYKGLL